VRNDFVLRHCALRFLRLEVRRGIVNTARKTKEILSSRREATVED
jgi:hypothetical protein